MANAPVTKYLISVTSSESSEYMKWGEELIACELLHL